MANKNNSVWTALPVLFGFFVMGFCDIVGISSDYAASAFGWSSTMAGLISSVVFIWFFLLGVPFGVMMNRIGRKNTVLLSMAVTVVGMTLPLIHYDSVMTLLAYALLGIGNAILQVSVNPLLQNVITDEKLLTSSLTAGQVVKAVSSFVGPFIVLAAVNWFGGGDEGKWYYCFPIMGAITLFSGLWLLSTPIPLDFICIGGIGFCCSCVFPIVYGYQRRYNWFVTALSENALEVMTKMGTFIYYKLQPETLRLKIDGEPFSCDNGDSFVFADGVIAAIEDNKLTGVAKGTTYIQKYDATTKMVLSYKVVVE